VHAGDERGGHAPTVCVPRRFEPHHVSSSRPGLLRYSWWWSERRA
jgi:hypothetical protein